MLDHDTDSYYKISRAFPGSQAIGGLTRNRAAFSPLRQRRYQPWFS
jgi:hypothetical protein